MKESEMVFWGPVSPSIFTHFQYLFLATCFVSSKRNEGSPVSLNPSSLLLKGK